MNLSRFLENFLRREDPGSTSGTAKLFRSTSRGRSSELDFAEIHHLGLPYSGPRRRENGENGEEETVEAAREA